MTKKQTPSQTIGPFFSYGLAPQQYGYSKYSSIASNIMTTDQTEGEKINIEGIVFDGKGQPIPDALVEVWQADSNGNYMHPQDEKLSNCNFTGFGRCGTGVDKEYRFIFETVKPGATNDNQAPHLNIIIFMRGLLLHTYTRMYFPDEEAANAKDPVLSAVPKDRRHTLIAKQIYSAPQSKYAFDIHMQGGNETVFFDI